MICLEKYRKPVATFMLFVLSLELLLPATSYALTSGPAQPEMKGFEPLGNADLVDLFTGDFNYNIPLLDVGGYPLNIAYHAGAGMDDEASWVGSGWSLSPGVLNRQLRGLPDDFNGEDKITKTLNRKDHITKGAKFSTSLDLLGMPKSKAKIKAKKKKLNFSSMAFSLGVTFDNYRGVGVDLGANAGISLIRFAAGNKTPDQPDTSKLGGLGLNLSSFDGATVSLNANVLSKNSQDAETTTALSKSVGFGYNSRAGMTGMTLSSSYNTSKINKEENTQKTLRLQPFSDSKSSFISFNSPTYTPTSDIPNKSDAFTFNLTLGPEVFVAYVGFGATGFYTRQQLAANTRQLPAFGYLHSERSKTLRGALLDLNREKDIPYSKNVNFLPVPVPTNDFFTASSQEGSAQYRAFRGSSAVLFDNKTESVSRGYAVGIEVGAGSYFDVGGDLYYQNIKNVSQKWSRDNKFLNNGDYQTSSAEDPLFEPVYFKRVGEPVATDNDYLSKIYNTSPVGIQLPKSFKTAITGATAANALYTRENRKGTNINSKLSRTKREIKNQDFSYLTAAEAEKHAFEKEIIFYHPDSLGLDCSSSGKVEIERVSAYRKKHHISEVTVLSKEGKRMIYGIPVYNQGQVETSFSVTEDLSKRNRGIINYSAGDNSINNTKGREHFYSKDSTPPYATSFLLTAVLSPDYVDATGNGITDDDAGTAIKFKYSKLSGNYQWRSPYDSANYNEGFLSTPVDDKASYVYGSKEINYLHSVESKTMVAHFILEGRNDGLGVASVAGSKGIAVTLKRLKEIRLYSKSDYQKNSGDLSKLVPIKTVHFEYDYSICKGIPNTLNTGEGKLTLRKVYFTFGRNQKGKLNPYQFHYDSSYNYYDQRQYDRWGTLKLATNNPGGLNNSEFPYTLQDSALNAAYVSAGQLKKIELPSGGSINVTYEADDYAFIQDKRAAQMCFLKGINSSNDSTGLIGANQVLVTLPVAVANKQELIQKYFTDKGQQMSRLYFKVFADMDNKGHYEFVPGYAEIKEIDYVNATTAKIILEKMDNVNPISKACWQFLRMNLPQYAYPGSDNYDAPGNDLVKSIKALVTALGSIKELISGFEGRAKNKKFADKIKLSKSWVRLYSPSFKKYGGGARVKRITTSDNWQAMSGTAGAKTGEYIQLYDYTMKSTDNSGNQIIISSGVAAYEPLIGNDENPFRQPINYKQKQFLALDNYFYVEEPFGESFFPAASVGYSRVSVKNIGMGDSPGSSPVGQTVSEFYTAKDFPTRVDWLEMEVRRPNVSNILKLVSTIITDHVGLSQGYAIEVNDMHGKPKGVQVWNRANQKISSVEYIYKTDNPYAETFQLNNDVKVLHTNTTIDEAKIGLDVELFSDMREETTDNLGVSVKVSGGSGAALFFPIPFFFPGIGVNYEKRSYRAASTVKLISRFGILEKVRKMEHGSNITTENVLWDAKTGDVLLTKTQNEFEDPIYSFNYPAHWIYDGMGLASENLGTLMDAFSTGTNGEVVNAVYRALLAPGDELIDLQSTNRYWVVNSAENGSGNAELRIIDAYGNVQQLSAKKIKIARSGRRNMPSSSVATLVTLKNPFEGNTLNVNSFTQVLDAKATEFEEQWQSLCANIKQDSCYTYYGGYGHCPDSSVAYFFKYLIDFEKLFTSPYDQLTIDSLVTLAISEGYDINRDSCPLIKDNLDNLFYAMTENHEDTIYKAYFGNSVVHLQSGTNELIDFTKLKFYRLDSLSHRPIFYIDPYHADSPSVTFIRKVAPFTKVVYTVTDITTQQVIKDSIDNTSGVEILDTVQLTAGYKIFNTEYQMDDHQQFYYSTVDECPYIKKDLEFYSGGTVNAAHGFSRILKPSSTVTLSVSDDNNSVSNVDVDCTVSLLPQSGVGKKCIVNEEYINPYVRSLLGNWRPKRNHVYHADRKLVKGTDAQAGSTNIRKSGYYTLFQPFWTYGSAKWNQPNSFNDPNWIWANEITHVNQKGFEIENRDALNRYSAALFGYLQSLPVAVASNSAYKEIAYDGFEDYSFNVDCSNGPCENDHLGIKNLVNGGTLSVTNAEAHTGQYSLKVDGVLRIPRLLASSLANSTDLFQYDAQGRYILRNNELSRGFTPLKETKYVLSFWIKDNNPRSPSTNVTVRANGISLVNSTQKWPVVESWKRIEASFWAQSWDNTLLLEINAGGSIYVDDIRIHPFDGQMKSFAYNSSNQRLMAEMDENNLATFYEYDDEGTLIRVKKETERGIMTIRETRSSLKRK